MDRLTSIALQVGAWRIDPQLGQMSRGTETVRLEARTLRLLMYLANRAGETVGIEELLDQVWSGVVVTQDSVYQAITALRRLLGDDAKQPTYIVTVPRLGYRLIAPVRAAVEEPVPAVPPPCWRPRHARRVSRRLALWCAAIALAGMRFLLLAIAARARTRNPSPCCPSSISRARRWTRSISPTGSPRSSSIA